MRRSHAVLLAAAAAVLLASVPAAAADPLPFPTHTGAPGVHALLDGQENRSVRCVYGGPTSDLVRVVIEPPVAFAQNRTARTDAGVIGWRWQLLGDTGAGWTVVRSGPLVKRAATDGRAADFRRATVDLAAAPLPAYRVRHRLIWYKPGSRTKQVATAVHWAERYRTASADLPPSIQQCYSSVPPGLPFETPTDHLGDYGMHAIVDGSERPGLRCTYRGADLPLTRIGIGPAVAFAPDRTGHTDKAVVTRRIVLQSTDVVVAGSWTDRKVLGVEKRSATDRRMASFPGRTIKLGTTGPDHPGWRIVVRFRFLAPGGGELGRVLEEPAYSWHDDGSPATLAAGLCFGQD